MQTYTYIVSDLDSAYKRKCAVFVPVWLILLNAVTPVYLVLPANIEVLLKQSS